VPAEDARDLTREFFARLLSNAWLHDVNPGRGRFRSWLIASMKHFLANEWDKARAQKRGGGLAFYELDAQTAEGRYAIEPADGFSAEKLYDRRRALTPLDRTLERLGEEMAQSGRLKQFESLKFCLSGERGPSYAAVAPGTPLARCKSPLAAAKK
jgi:RNA polymerase sigma-70 factor (ECF subfamily)